jgi:hypothetical protein
MRTHQDAKVESLRNAVINSALPTAPDMDLRAFFLHLVDELSPTHLRTPKRNTSGCTIGEV